MTHPTFLTPDQAASLADALNNYENMHPFDNHHYYSPMAINNTDYVIEVYDAIDNSYLGQL